jgi:LytS/YehU family sensor histidine kinase
MDQHLNDSAMFYFKKSILSEKDIDNYVLSRVYRYMAIIENESGNSRNTMLYINKSISLAKKDSMSKVISEDYNWLAEYYSSNHNFEKAYYYKTQSALINDSLLTETKMRQTKEIEAIYQNEKKQTEINLLSEHSKVATLKLRNNRIFLIFLSILSLLIIGLSVLIIRQNKLKANNKSLELEHKLLRSQMNPHFIFNALAAIQNQVMNKPAIEAASYLSGFARLMRSILNSSRNETVPLSQEVETLEEYLKLQKLRLGERLNYRFIYQLNDDISEIAIPPMLLQPFLENAVEHGIAKKEVPGGNMWISFIQAKDTLTVTIEDDGIGLQASSLSNQAGHTSLATRITEERMQALSKTFKSKFLFSVENRLSDNAEVIGAKVILQLPLLFVTN